MMIISGVMSIIIQKNMLCANKICVIYFSPNCINFLPENIFYFWGGDWPPCPPSSCTYGGLDSLPEKGVLGHFADLREALEKKRWVVFLRGLIPQCTMCMKSRNFFLLRAFNLVIKAWQT